MTRLATLLSALLLGAFPAAAQDVKISGGVVRIGVLSDRSGPYSGVTGEGSAVAARLAAEEFGNKVLGRPVEILVGDHQNKADLGAVTARRWFDTEDVDMIADAANSAVGFAILGLVKERGKVLLHNAASADFTGKACAATAVQWNVNTFANAKVLAQAGMAQGYDTWFTIAPDFAFGRALAADLRRFVEAGGGKVVGEVFNPLGAPDFSSFLLQAQGSGAKVIAMGNVGSDFVNSVKQANEFGLTRRQTLATFTINLTDMEPIGLETAGGFLAVSTFEWDRNDASRTWTKRFSDRTGTLPSAAQAATYSAVRHYLRAVEAAGTDEGPTVVAKMRELPVRDAFAENGRVREDGQFVHDLFLVRAKKPADSKGRGDYFDIVQTVSGDEAFQSLADSACPLVKK